VNCVFNKLSFFSSSNDAIFSIEFFRKNKKPECVYSYSFEFR